MDNNDKNDASVLVRMPAELKSALLRQAAINKRRITAEINVRLAASLQKENEAIGTGYHSGRPPVTLAEMAENTSRATYPNQPSTSAIPLNDRPHPATAELNDHDRALLALFRQLPPEKQLSLLTLLR